jgi:hypothetical protein
MCGVYTVILAGSFTKYTVMYGVYIRFWSALSIECSVLVILYQNVLAGGAWIVHAATPLTAAAQ